MRWNTKSSKNVKKSNKSGVKVDFKPDTTIYQKDFNFEGKPFKIKMDVKPQKFNAPTIEMKERD